MPRIQAYEQQGSYQTGLPGKETSPADFGASVGQALTMGGEAAGLASHRMQSEQERIAAKLEAKAQQDANFEADKQVAMARTAFVTRVKQLSDNPPEGGAGMTEQFVKEFDAYSSKALEGLTSDHARKRMEIGLENLKGGLIDNVIGLQSSLAGQYRREQTKTMLSGAINNVRAMPQLHEETAASVEAMVRATPGLSIDQQNSVIKESRSALAGAAIDGSIDALQQMADVAPQAARQELAGYEKHLQTSESWKAVMSPLDYAKALDRVRTLQTQLGGRADKLALDALDATIAQRRSGVDNGLTPESASFIVDPTSRTLATRKIQEAIAIGDRAAKIKDMPINDIMLEAKSIEDRLKDPAKAAEFASISNEAKAFDSAIKDRLTSYKNDQAQYVLSMNSDASRALGEMQKSPSSKAVENYVAAQTVAQQRLGFPGQPVKLLTNDMLGEISIKIGAIENTPEGADKAHQLLTNEQTKWGRNWPIVYSQLVSEKALSGPLAMAGRMNEPRQQPAALDLLRAQYIGAETLYKTIAIPDAKKQVHENILTTLGPLQQTLSLQGNGYERYKDVASSVELTAALYMSQGESDPKRAVQRAADNIILNDYVFVDRFRVPKTYKGKPLDTSSVVDGTRFVQQNLSDSINMNIAGDLKYEDIQRQAIRSLRDGGIWITNGDETGLQLLSPDGTRSVVLELTWDALVSAGTKPEIKGKPVIVQTNPGGAATGMAQPKAKR